MKVRISELAASFPVHRYHPTFSFHFNCERCLKELVEALDERGRQSTSSAYSMRRMADERYSTRRQLILHQLSEKEATTLVSLFSTVFNVLNVFSVSARYTTGSDSKLIPSTMKASWVSVSMHVLRSSRIKDAMQQF